MASKSANALAHGLSVVCCVGETLEEREAGTTMDVVTRQLGVRATARRPDPNFTSFPPRPQAVADKLGSDAGLWESMAIAYEPVWAIGTGKVATPEQAQEVHAALRHWLANKTSADIANQTRIIYGRAGVEEGWVVAVAWRHE